MERIIPAHGAIPSTQKRIDAIAHEARLMRASTQRRYIAARCANYSPEQALAYAQHPSDTQILPVDLFEPIHEVAGQQSLPFAVDGRLQQSIDAQDRGCFAAVRR